MQCAFIEFATWFGNCSGSKKAALSLSRYVGFFQDIESHWTSIPPYSSLAEYFGVDALRRFRKAMQWLSDAKHIHPNQHFKERIAETQRIGRMVKSVPPGTRVSVAFNEYKEELLKRREQGSIKLISVRLSLTPAVGLIQLCAGRHDNLPTQEVVDHYLADHPGQRAAISGFISFLNKRYQLQLAIPSASKTLVNRRAKVERHLVALAKLPWSEQLEVEWMTSALEYFHGVTGISPKVIGKLERGTQEGEVTFVLAGQVYLIPVPCSWSRSHG